MPTAGRTSATSSSPRSRGCTGSTRSASTATAMTSHRQSSRRRSTLPSRPTSHWLESNSHSLHRTQGGSRRRATAFCAKWRTRYPSAVACVEDDLDALLAHLRFPAEHWRRIRHSNLIERTFGETRRRVKVIGRLPGERSCLTLIWAVLDRQSKGWRGLTMTPKALRDLQDLRRDLFGQRRQREGADKAGVRAAA